ncbi:MAG: 5-formyltetrahydrofolate cyclo-ligase [Chitinophagaceae bacterium]|nr:5-formyltetrahydrofolate cyclo-ligase [Chitinophagaceae bacterium]
MTKAELRIKYKEKRKNITASQKLKWDDLILINFQKIELSFINCVHTYLAAGEQNEIDTENILRYLKFINPEMLISVPKIDAVTGQLDHYIYDENLQMAINSFGIPEPLDGEKILPSAFDLILVPMLAFDSRGYRVGYGKGFYDKFLQGCRADVIKIGLSYFEPVDAIGDINEFDIPLNYCVTPQSIYQF